MTGVAGKSLKVEDHTPVTIQSVSGLTDSDAALEAWTS